MYDIFLKPLPWWFETEREGGPTLRLREHRRSATRFGHLALLRVRLLFGDGAKRVTRPYFSILTQNLWQITFLCCFEVLSLEWWPNWGQFWSGWYAHWCKSFNIPAWYSEPCEGQEWANLLVSWGLFLCPWHYLKHFWTISRKMDYYQYNTKSNQSLSVSLENPFS